MNDLANKKDIFNVVKTDEVEALKNSKIVTIQNQLYSKMKSG